MALSVRLVNKHLIRAIEDVGVLATEVNPDRTTESTDFGSPTGYGSPADLPRVGNSSRPGPIPGLTTGWDGDDGHHDLALPKRRGLLGRQLSRKVQPALAGRGQLYVEPRLREFFRLAPARAAGRASNGLDRWFMGYDGLGDVLTGPLPQDRSHYLGLRAIPSLADRGSDRLRRSASPYDQGLFNSKYFYPDGRADLGRLPFTFRADIYTDDTIKIAGKYRASINLQINNVTNTDTIQSKIMTYNRSTFSGNTYFRQILDGTFVETYKTTIDGLGINHAMYNEWDTRFATWSGRLGVKFSF
jgi:hypothetical protein